MIVVHLRFGLLPIRYAHIAPLTIPVSAIVSPQRYQQLSLLQYETLVQNQAGALERSSVRAPAKTLGHASYNTTSKLPALTLSTPDLEKSIYLQLSGRSQTLALATNP